MPGRLAALLMAALALPSGATVVEPRVIERPEQLRPGEGALLLSVRHQSPIAQDMHLWFANGRVPDTSLRLRRGTGSGFGWAGTMQRRVLVYAVPAGRWTLRSHSAGCTEEPPEGRRCVMAFGGGRFDVGAPIDLPMPLTQARYPADWIGFELGERQIVDLGELLLEFPPGTPLGRDVVLQPEEVRARILALRFRQRPLPVEALAGAAPFRSLGRGTIEVAPQARSAVQCQEAVRRGTIRYIPFHC